MNHNESWQGAKSWQEPSYEQEKVLSLEYAQLAARQYGETRSIEPTSRMLEIQKALNKSHKEILLLSGAIIGVDVPDR